MRIPGIIAVSRVPEGITIFFSDGSQGFYPIGLLYRLLDSAEVRSVHSLDDLEEAS